jgi:hypothetical protein
MVPPSAEPTVSGAKDCMAEWTAPQINACVRPETRVEMAKENLEDVGRVSRAT